MRRAIAVILASLGLGCGGNPDPEAGDADTSEEGCGTVGQSCNVSPDCPGGQVCVDYSCDCALDRQYQVTIMSGQVYNRTLVGGCWDDDPPSCDDLPDVYARVQIGESSPYETEVCSSPSENEPHVLLTWTDATFTVQIEAGMAPQIWLYDVDGDSEELMGEYSIEALDHLQVLTVETLRQGGRTISIPAGNDMAHEINLMFSPL